MTSYELKSRIQKANEKIQKKTATIAKKETWIASGKKDEYEIKWLQEDISRLTREIAETQKTVEKYEKQLAGELEREKKHCDVLQWALAANMMLADAMKALTAQYPDMDVTFKRGFDR